MYIVHHSDPLQVPRLTVNSASTDVEYKFQSISAATTRVITGYEVIRFGVPMIGEYANKGNPEMETSITISPAVPGAQYRITAWALGDDTRSATPAVEYVTTEEAGELHSLHKDIARGLLCIVHRPVFTESKGL